MNPSEPRLLRVEAVADLPAADLAELVNQLTQRLNGMYWKGRSLTVQAMTR